MKRSWIKKVGKTGRANINSRRKIAEICEELNLNTCEIKLSGCLYNWPLAPAHKHKRAWYKGDEEKLADFNEWVVACQVCHDTIEHNQQLTEETFARLRQ